ncbi:MAG TPA: M20/M25/M40 family metallo-hydrolase [Deltaproteobacteria bacterium]|nr:M20/M25/M40 family metallo-hydrolase [Deltaproteobacteria bacterium]
MENIYREIDSNSERYLEELFTLLKQPSISSQGVGVEDCAKLLAGMMEDVGIRTEILPMGGKNNPPLVYGELLSPGAEKTVLIYGHFDVQPTDPLEAWDSPPFEPTIRDGRIFCRGSADNKGQLFAHVKAVEAILKTEGSLPVNLKFLFDPEEEIGSPSLDDFVMANADRFRADVAYNSDGAMDASGRPILSFGNRGNCYVEINHREAKRDLHSGQFGGPVPNPNWRMMEFLNTLRDSNGRVAIDGFYDDIVPPTAAEKEAMANIPFNEASQLDYLGLQRFDGPENMGYWEKIMFQPTLNICGYVSGYGGEGQKTVLPCSVKVKIDMRLVKNQDPPDIFDKFKRHMEKRGFDDLELKLLTTYRPAKTPIDHPMSKAVISAVKKAFESEPILYPVTGGSNPSSIICDFLKIPIVKVPYGNHDESNHAPNENMVVDLFYKGIKCSATVFYELSRL